MISISALVTLSFLVSGIVASSNDNNLSQTCGIFALIGSGFNTATNFTITAFDPSELAPINGGTPLAIGALTSGGDDVLLVPPAEIFATTFNLTNGTLFAVDHEADIAFTAALLTNGSDTSFADSSGGPLSIPQFCAVAATDPAGGSPFPGLAVNGTTGVWSLCNSTLSEGTQIIVFRAAKGNSGYNLSTCAAVNLFLTRPAFKGE